MARWPGLIGPDCRSFNPDCRSRQSFPSLRFRRVFLKTEEFAKGVRVSTANLDGVIRDGRHEMQVRIYFEDTDFGQIVYHANYLRFMERGRTNYLRLLGADHRALFEQTRDEAPGFAFVVRSMAIEYFKPAFMDDVLDIITVPEEIRGASITLSQECRRAGELLVSARVKVAFISGGKAQRIPKPLRDAMQADRAARTI
jgi:acyl-CoA thioester hydrolase